MSLIRFHCEVLNRENAILTPCERPAHLIYVDKEGVRHGYCVEDTRLGVTESARHEWSLDLPRTEAA